MSPTVRRRLHTKTLSCSARRALRYPEPMVATGPGWMHQLRWWSRKAMDASLAWPLLIPTQDQMLLEILSASRANWSDTATTPDDIRDSRTKRESLIPQIRDNTPTHGVQAGLILPLKLDGASMARSSMPGEQRPFSLPNISFILPNKFWLTDLVSRIDHGVAPGNLLNAEQLWAEGINGHFSQQNFATVYSQHAMCNMLAVHSVDEVTDVAAEAMHDLVLAVKSRHFPGIPVCQEDIRAFLHVVVSSLYLILYALI